MNEPGINVSLEPHLAETLAKIRGILPKELAAQLEAFLNEPRPPTIPHSLLDSVSRWSRTPIGTAELSRTSLHTGDYLMVSLLAGTMSSPERKFGTYVPPPDPEVVAAQKREERKQITALANGVLSIGGAAFAAFWASQHMAWKHEWRVLFAFMVGIVVAISEAVLYIIWQSRKEKAAKPKRRVTRAAARRKKDDGGEDETVSQQDELGKDESHAHVDDGLRRRTAPSL
ncbi:hypothetical protein CYLTODRAFT_373084 [Cylindrobasidium torrendii FP15055 ss-10]|uniref:Endoplasmic reticulum-based factor for assembly of V-ATPase n=1 Tax=Cylindrobasidium torrendii FP15055 ss-10 TaxID=1314674 RepID=A0A0D7BGI4_9AGAR|nr:hypothetical protein CYLTODRAFT_373084 [Cylindrobasidium torrendii FP15055 ss-10]